MVLGDFSIMGVPTKCDCSSIVPSTVTSPVIPCCCAIDGVSGCCASTTFGCTFGFGHDAGVGGGGVGGAGVATATAGPGVAGGADEVPSVLESTSPSLCVLSASTALLLSLRSLSCRIL